MKALLVVPLLGLVVLPGFAPVHLMESGNSVWAGELGQRGPEPVHDGSDSENNNMVTTDLGDDLGANESDMSMDMNVGMDMNYGADPLPEAQEAPQVVQGWSLREDRSGCSISTSFEDGSLMILGYDTYDRDGFLYLSNSNWASIADGRTYFLTVDMPPFPQRVLRASGIRTNGIPGFAIAFDGVNFLAQFMEAEGIAIAHGRNRVGAFSLRGSYAAAVELARCNRRALNQVPRDPFAE